MIRKLVSTLIFTILNCISFASISATELSWDIGLTEQRNLITASGVMYEKNAPTILYLAGLEGSTQNSAMLNALLENYSQSSPTDSAVNLIVIANANPDSEPLQFPPTGTAFSENSVSHVLWRWIGTHAPDLIVLEAGQDFGFSTALEEIGIAGFGNIPIESLSASNTTRV